ncbi:hypothetical protein Mal15_62220 [Stieleria maiorica]|uniref:Transposase IS200-like domain-containing protein n=1 Tax=Stieleria maiorica TaxID=2795974 RepID=A0A5B9MLE2_9BACT|nr:hypothetical protein [Stieleria maiorica]QEG02139.1 hypothetical protein Mal15_62220 [Stieleria maiorica]
MSRSNRGDKLDPREVQIVHAITRTTRACYLLGDDPATGKNYDHRKRWVESLIERFAAQFAIDVLAYSVLSTHHHQMLRSRPDVVATWDNTEVARRWLMICPKRKDADGNPMAPTDPELDTIRNSPDRLSEIRLRLSDVSWWMRLLNQRVAQRANREDGASGRFFEDRFKGIPVIDDESVLACAVYVDLNWIRACMAETLELSDYTSAQRRIASLETEPKEPEIDRDLQSEASAESDAGEEASRQRLSDSFLAPVNLCEATAQPGPQPSGKHARCSDKGFLPISNAEYLELLDWSARQVVNGKSGKTPGHLPPILLRLGLSPTIWLELVADFDDLFTTMAGLPENIDQQRGKQTGRPFHVRKRTRELFAQAA